MKIDDLVEGYGENNTFLRKYLRDKHFSVSDHAHLVKDWAEQNDMLTDELEEAIENFDHETIQAWEESLEPSEREELVDHVVDQLVNHDPAEAPAWAHMDYNEFLPRNTWLVHFSDHAEDIAIEGFRYGFEDMERLGLTTYFSDKTRMSYQGYNFAFTADSRYASNAARARKYGRDAVLFTNGGVEVTHYGDEEHQVIFWGADVKPGQLIYLKMINGDWHVIPMNSKWKGFAQGRESIFHSDRFENVVEWVKQHHVQYRSVLFHTR